MGGVAARRTDHWAGTASGANAEVIVERAAMDGFLRQAAQSAGATLLPDTAVPRAGGALLAGGGAVTGRMVFDARGRRPHRDRPRAARGPATVAIGAEVRAASDMPAGTRILPLDEGWLWFACQGGGPAGWVQLTLGAADPRSRPPDERLRRGIVAAGALLPLDWNSRARCSSAIRRRSCRCRPVAGSPAGGDAAAAMDPLSGHGMLWAVSSALAATAVRRTLGDADDEASRRLALRFLNQRQSDLYLRQARLGRDFIRAEGGRARLPLWSRRAAFPEGAPVGGEAGGSRLRSGPLSRAAG